MDGHTNTLPHNCLVDRPNASTALPGTHSEATRDPSLPKLGDFTSLYATTTGFNPPHYFLSHLWPSDGGSKLGDLSKVVDQLRIVDNHSQLSSSVELRANAPRSTVSGRNERPQINSAQNLAADDLSSLPLSDSESPATQVVLSRDRVSTPNSSSPALLPEDKSHPVSSEERDSDANADRSREKRPRKIITKSQTLLPILSYQLTKNGLIFPVFGKLQTVEDAHESLSLKLVNHCAIDGIVSKQYPSIADHGLHVFLDMSNIDISFHKALRTKYNLADSVRFSPPPRLNLQFLSEVLIRARPVRCLSVGCSTAPGRPAPKYVEELRELGYRVDLRERRRAGETGHTLPKRGSPVHGFSSAGSRYVEDLVDETLQTRIAEAVMEYFQQQGTIVLATGDAKPAQYSDGFFMYVDRALRMGWNVELVSWRASLSSAWTDKDWVLQWGDRFRIIELDNLLDDLLTAYL